MRHFYFRVALFAALILGSASLVSAASGDKSAPAKASAAPTQVEASPSAKDTEPAVEADDANAHEHNSDDADRHGMGKHRHHWDRHSGSAVVHIGGDSHLAAGQKAEAVVSIGGSSSSDGDVSDSVVSIFGSTQANGPVGNSAVAILGDTTVNNKIHGDVVAVFGDVTLGPQAEVGGNVVAVGGVLKSDPAAIIHGTTQEVSMPFATGHAGWLRQWIKECFFLGRPLAFHAGLGWAWTLALGFLGFYILLALLFNKGIEQCARTFEEQPGKTVLTSILTLILSPVACFMLVVTLIGMVLVPVLGIALFFAGLFGKAAVLATLGRRVTNHFPDGPLKHPAVAVAIGGALILLLYVIPIIGFIVYKVLGILGTGLVIYTLLLAHRARRAAMRPVAPTPDVAAATVDGASVGEIPTTPPLTSGPLPAQTALAMPRAGFWIRMLALLIDVILVGVVISVLHASHNIELVLLAAYGAVMWKLRGTTVGGIVCDLEVVRINGMALDWPTAIVRALGCFLSLIVAGLGFIWIAVDAEKQSWHDKIAGTVVVRKVKLATVRPNVAQ